MFTNRRDLDNTAVSSLPPPPLTLLAASQWLTCEVAGTIFSKESRKDLLTAVGLTISSRPDTRVEWIFRATALNTRSSSNTEELIVNLTGGRGMVDVTPVDPS